jgi:hypothetical protein
MTRLFLILALASWTDLIYAQNPGDIFLNENCESIYFVNDSIVDFLLSRDITGARVTLRKGLGVYKIDGSSLTIKIIEPINFQRNKESTIPVRECGEFREITSGLDKYKIENKLNGSIVLTGPIIDNYERLNRKRFLKGFMNWPWKWSFKKQHWYDPRQRPFNK